MGRLGLWPLVRGRPLSGDHVVSEVWHNGRKGGCQYWDGWGEPGVGVPSGGDELAISQFSPRLGWVDRYTVAVGLYDPASVSLTGD